MNPWPTHAVAACESECDLCNECIFEGSPVCDVGSGWAHRECSEQEQAAIAADQLSEIDDRYGY